MDQARTLLNGIQTLRRPCDLDLLVFFAKHPRTLLSSEQLARLLGYELKEIARSLDGLLGAGYLTRSQKQNRTRPARMYVFSADALNGGPLPAIVRLASSREGRLRLRLALTPSPAGGRDDLATEAGNHAAAPPDAPPLEPETTGTQGQMSSRGGKVDGGP